MALQRRYHQRTFTPTPGLPKSWEVHTSWKIAGKIARPGTPLKVRGRKDRYVFVKYVKNHDNGAEWIECTTGGKACGDAFAAFRPDEVVIG